MPHYQHAPRVTVAGLGDLPLRTLGAAGVFRGHQAEEAHQFARARKAGEIPDLGDHRHGRYHVDAPQRHERLDYRAHPPVLELRAHRVSEHDRAF